MLAATPAGTAFVPPSATSLATTRAAGRLWSMRLSRSPRRTGERPVFSTAHPCQMVYHGPIAYADDPYEWPGRAASDLECLLLLIFRKPAAPRA